MQSKKDQLTVQVGPQKSPINIQSMMLNSSAAHDSPYRPQYSQGTSTNGLQQQHQQQEDSNTERERNSQMIPPSLNVNQEPYVRMNSDQHMNDINNESQSSELEEETNQP